MKYTAFMFSGQGTQYPGMMKDFFDCNKAARDVFEVASNELQRDIRELCFYGSEEELSLTENTQPCMLTAEVAAFEVLKESGIIPNAVAGFSLGEYSALVSAGVIAFKDAIKIVQIRANAMQRAVPLGKGAMAAIKKASEEKVLDLCNSVDGYVAPANYNSPGQIVVSGQAEAVKKVINKALSENIVALELNVSAPFHCILMEPASKELEVALRDIEFKSPIVPIYMNVDAKPEINVDMIRQKLVLQAKTPVLWSQTISNMYFDGYKSFVEIGPGNTLLKLAKKILKGKDNIKISKVESIEDINLLKRSCD